MVISFLVLLLVGALQHLALVHALALVSALPQLSLIHTGLLMPACTDPSIGTGLDKLTALLGAIKNTVIAIGGTAFIISITIAGIMRMTAYGNERRIAMSNMAITAAIVGAIIMVLAQGLYTFVTSYLGCPA